MELEEPIIFRDELLPHGSKYRFRITCLSSEGILWVRIYFGIFFVFFSGFFFVFRPGQQNIVFYSIFSRN